MKCVHYIDLCFEIAWDNGKIDIGEVEGLSAYVLIGEDLSPNMESEDEIGSVRNIRALAGVAQWIECWPLSQKVTGSIPSQGTCLGCRPCPQLGVC